MDTPFDVSLEYLRSMARSVRVRYLDTGGGAESEGGGGGKAPVTPQGPVPHRGKTATIVIHRPYAFLVPAIHSLFERDEDVQVLVDRRHCERNAFAVMAVGDGRFRTWDRRRSLPILDVVINLET